MANLTDPLEVRVLDYALRAVTPPALTGPMRVQLVSALGAGDAPSTPIAGSIQPLGATAATSGAGTSENAALIRFENIPSGTNVAGYRIIDSDVTPTVTVDNIARTGGPVVVNDGVFEIPAGELDFTAG